MKKLTYNAIYIILTLLFTTLSTHNMERMGRWQTSFSLFDDAINTMTQEHYKQQALLAEAYNQNNPLFSCPNDVLNLIFSDQDLDPEEALKNSIKNFMRLSTTCKHFNRLLTFETIGNLCKGHALTHKNRAFCRLLLSMMKPSRYQISRLPIFVLLCAGADDHSVASVADNKKEIGGALLDIAIEKQDIELVNILLEYGANPNEKYINTPIFFDSTKEIAQLFIDKGVNFHALDADDNNVLYRVVYYESYSSELIPFYIAHSVDARKCDSRNNESLLHSLARPVTNDIDDIDDFLKKGIFLLNAIPDMINSLDIYRQTPRDIAQKSLKIARRTKGGTPQAYKQLIALYKQHGGKTAKKLIKK